MTACGPDAQNGTPHFHTIGIGAGPANLSLAALFEAVRPDKIALMDRQPGPSWHPELLHPGVRMQTSWVKDLVSLVDPCHHLSFLNYLVSSGRIYTLMNAQYDVIPRLEYARYLSWASERLEHVYYGVSVDRVCFDEGFSIYSGDRHLARSDHLVLGLGSQPYVPPTFRDLLGEQVFGPEQLHERIDLICGDPEASVAVVGGGQTGAECVLSLLASGCRDLLWFGRRPWFQPMDDSPPANDFYRPAYQQFLHTVSPGTRRRLIEGEALTGDAITPAAVKAIFQANYDAMLHVGRFPLTLLPCRDVVAGRFCDDGMALDVVAVEGNETHHARYVVLATGRRNAPLPFDPDLMERMPLDESGDIVVNDDYSVSWQGAGGHKIYAQNRAKFTHGVADANLTLLPIRSATIINAVFERQVFTFRDELISTVW